MGIEIRIGADAILSYQRLAYTPWHAIAEFVDNSTQSYFNHQEVLDEALVEEGEQLRISIVYDRDREGGLLRVADNSIGMSYEELQRAMHVALPPANTSGRSKYGMGLKTAACWIGNRWRVRTKKLGETVEHEVTVDVNRIAQGTNDLGYVRREGKPESEHYTLVEITDHNRRFQGRTIAKIREYLGSMYREDLRCGFLRLEWDGLTINWVEPELLKANDGQDFRKEFRFEVDAEAVWGWVGILANGTRSRAGFSIIHSGRVVKGWPESWRPASLYGQLLGSNDLVNQRLVGEIHLDGFQVSHTKDDILWLGDQEDEVERLLLEHVGDVREFAKIPKKNRDGEIGPSEAETKAAVDEMQRELQSPQVVDKVMIDDVPPEEVIAAAIDHVTEAATRKQPTLSAALNGISVYLYLDGDLSPNDPYVAVQPMTNEVLVIVNRSHPHWAQIKGSDGVLNYLRHCIYDGLSEWKAAMRHASLHPRTIKLIKDSLLRAELEIVRN